MRGAPPGNINRVGQKVDDAFERLGSAAHASRQIDNQYTLAYRYQAARKSRQPRFPDALAAHQLRQPGYFLLRDRARRLRSNVTWCKARTSRGEDRVAVIAAGPAVQALADS